MEKIKNTILNQLGLIAGMCNEIELIQTIDSYIPKPKRKVSVGQAVQAMVLNGLGFTGRALYLTPHFYKNLPLELLLGEGIEASDLHDDCLGTALDALYETGITELFYNTAGRALNICGINYQFVHLDSTSFSLYGEYDEDEETKAVKITKGFSKDHAPELNQVITTLMCSYRSSIPVWLEVLNGNDSDKVTFRKSIREYCRQFKQKQLPYFVADSALYTKESLQELTDVKWVTRVPETIKEAKTLIQELDPGQMKPCDNEEYRILPVQSEYAGIRQRWILVYSAQAHQRTVHTFRKNVQKEAADTGRKFWHLSNRSFACEADALKEAAKFNRGMKWHTLQCKAVKKQHYEKKGRPSKQAEPTGEQWFLEGTIIPDEPAIASIEKTKGVFIIATNELDESRLSDESLLNVYKSQGVSVERGFRFLKDPMFYAESLYLNSSKRIMALIMVMGLSLLVYSLTERKLRNALKDQNLTVPNQIGKQINNPTIRWVYQLFNAILLIQFTDTGRYSVMNMEESHKTIITALGPPFKKIYFWD